MDEFVFLTADETGLEIGVTAGISDWDKLSDEALENFEELVMNSKGKTCPCGNEDCQLLFRPNWVDWTEFEKLAIESRWGQSISFWDQIRYWTISDLMNWLLGR